VSDGTRVTSAAQCAPYAQNMMVSYRRRSRCSESRHEAQLLGWWTHPPSHDHVATLFILPDAALEWVILEIHIASH